MSALSRWSVLYVSLFSSAAGAVEGSAQVCGEVSLSVRSETAGTCGADRLFRFAVTNDTAGRVDHALLRFPRRTPEGAAPEQNVVCPSTPGLCELKVTPADVTFAELKEVHPECFLSLAPGDGFSCRVEVEEPAVAVTLTARSAAIPLRVDVTARCDLEPNVTLDGALSVADEPEGTCGQDRVFRFGVVNVTGRKLERLLLRYPRPEREGQVLICPTSEGMCELRRFAPDVPLVDLLKRSDCRFELAAGDGFACRVPVEQAAVEVTLSAEAADRAGAPLFTTAQHACR